MSNASRYTSLAARLFLAVVFLAFSAMKVTGWQMTVGYATAKGLPFPPVSIGIAVAIEILGSLGLILGFRARWAAILLFVYLIPTTLIFHNFWASQGQEQYMQLVDFLKNLAIMGGLLMIAADGPGPISIDARTAESH